MEKEIVSVYGGVAGRSGVNKVEVNLQTLPSDDEPQASATERPTSPSQPNALGLSKARQVALIATLTGAAFLNVGFLRLSYGHHS